MDMFVRLADRLRQQDHQIDLVGLGFHPDRQGGPFRRCNRGDWDAALRRRVLNGLVESCIRNTFR
jgi:hypothetical protein